jgi:hypothetical protein
MRSPRNWSGRSVRRETETIDDCCLLFFVKLLRILFSAALVLSLTLAPARATVDDALSFALEAADAYVKEGFTVREDYWGGDLPVKQTKAIVHQLFKGNEYWFWMGTDAKDAKISVHVYDGDGNLCEVEAKPVKVSGGGSAFATRVVPKKTGSYYLIVEVEKSSLERTTWSLAYGFR